MGEIKKSIITIAAMIILSLILFVYLLDSMIILICLSISGLAAVYFLASFLISKNTEGTSKRWYPAPFLLFSIFLPLIIGAIFLFFDFFSWVLIILLTSLTFVFFYNFLMIPLALASKYYEEKREGDPQAFPEITVLVPAFNEEDHIEKCIEGLLETDYPERKKQILVIDDGSTDKTLEKAKKYESDNLKVLHKKNGGKYSALNYGLMFADGDIVFSVDADSIVSRGAVKLMVKRFQSSSDIGAIAGNVKVLNENSFLTRCQALEYLVGINIFRTALDVFGSVSVVPGCLGAFRKNLLKGGGSYDPDTLTEDFDVTIKMRKLGKTVQASSEAFVFTEVPNNIKDLYLQRIRWYRGTFQTLLKHKNILTNPRFGLLQTLSYPFLLVSVLFLPIAGIVVLISIILSILNGLFLHMLGIFFFFNVIMILTSLLAVELEGSGRELLIYSPFLMFGYKHLLDLFKIKALIDVIRGKYEWTSPEKEEAG